jgi:polysaccharide biosynthesis transport protein
MPAVAEMPATPATGQDSSETTLSDALVVIRKRKYLIIAAALIGIAFGLYQANTQPRLYESSGTIEIRNGSANEFRLTASSTVGAGENNSRIPTEVAILKSDTLLLAVARDLDLANDPAFTGYKGPPRHVDLDDLNVRQDMLGHLQGAVQVAPLPKTDIIRISCSTLDKNLSSQIVNKLVREYIQRSFQSRFDATQRVSDWLSRQLDDLKQQVENSQEQMVELGKQVGVLGFDPTHNEITSTLEDLTKATGDAQIARIQTESRYKVLSSMNPNDLDASVDAGKVTGTTLSQLPTLRAQRETARTDLAKLSTTLGDNHPQVKALRNQISQMDIAIAAEQGRLLEQAKENYVAARNEEAQTKAALEAEKAEAYRLRDAEIEMTIRQREFESNRGLYEGLLQKLRTAGVQAGLESTEIDIIDIAVPATGPSLRPRSTIMLINGLIALIGGTILAFILDSLDTGLRSVAQIEAASGLVSLALIPRVRRTPADVGQVNPVLRSVQVLANPKSQFAESFRALRTSLLLSTAGHEPRVILLTSATPSEGKTTASINLACVLAQRDVRVLLIDADLRRPTIHHRFHLNGKVGLTSVLTGSVSLEDAVQKIPELPALEILTSGPVPPFPTEMLGSAAMIELLQRCKGIYTHIVMDSPPLLSVTDSVVLARDSDAVVLIVRQGKSSKHALRRARDILHRAGARITGVVLNSVDINSPEYYSYYGYYGYTSYSSAGVDNAGWEGPSGNGSKPREGGRQ